MENIKVKVNNEAESKEVIFLGEQLGYVRPHLPSCISMKNGGYVCLGFNYDGVQEDLILLIGGFKESDMNDIKDYKELTIPQLRDLVVLKRNDENDRTHTDSSGCDYYRDSSGCFYYKTTSKWLRTNELPECVVPIEKKEMKEFLVSHDGEWTLQLLDSDTEENSYRVAVPSGAEIYVYFDEFNRFNFYKENYSAVWQDDDYWDYDMDEYKKYCKKYGEILWQRSEDFTKVTIDELKHRVGVESNKITIGKLISQWDFQVGGDHYKSMKIQPAKFALENKLDYCQANAIKYICRHDSKSGKQDLEKAKHYIDLLIEHYYGDEDE